MGDLAADTALQVLQLPSYFLAMQVGLTVCGVQKFPIS